MQQTNEAAYKQGHKANPGQSVELKQTFCVSTKIRSKLVTFYIACSSHTNVISPSASVKNTL